MFATRSGLLVVCLLTLAGVTSAAESKRDAAVRALAARIDRHVAAGWEQAKVRPAATADDAVFLRRVYLDLIGRIPSIVELRDFLDEETSDKRRKIVTHLLSE